MVYIKQKKIYFLLLVAYTAWKFLGQVNNLQQYSERFQLIIDSLRAQQICAVIDFEKSSRYSTNLQNRILKGLQAINTLDQIKSAHRLEGGSTVTLKDASDDLEDDPNSQLRRHGSSK